LSISLNIATGYVDIAILNILRRAFPELLKLPSLWTHNCYVSMIGLVSKEAFEKYIEAQKGV
jgi:REP element-mobilizing transposase RayT